MHRCDECYGTIEAKEEYEHVWGIWDGSPSTFKTCADCLEFRDWFASHVPCVCWTYGDVHEIARENAREYDADCPGFKTETDTKIAAIRAKRRKWEDPTKEAA
jgi:hypothetical protein